MKCTSPPTSENYVIQLSTTKQLDDSGFSVNATETNGDSTPLTHLNISTSPLSNHNNATNCKGERTKHITSPPDSTNDIYDVTFHKDSVRSPNKHYTDFNNSNPSDNSNKSDISDDKYQS